MQGFIGWGLGIIVFIWLTPGGLSAREFSVATYNVENYRVQSTETRRAKSVAARRKVQEVLLTLNADVVALQEMGSLQALRELRTALKAGGLEYPHWEQMTGYDTNIHLAVISKFPIVARQPHSQEYYLLLGKRFQVSRGFLEVTLQVETDYRFTLLSAHLKSKRPVSFADEAEMREKEAQVLRRIVSARLKAEPDANLIVLGDLNDTHDSPGIKHLKGRGKSALIDSRPSEAGTGDPATSVVTWTYHYAVEDTYSRIDYLLLSPGMAREWSRRRTRIHTLPDWGLASDHRPIVAGFDSRDR